MTGDEVVVRSAEDIAWQDALVLLAFPTMGAAASIAGHYLRAHLDLPLVGAMYAPHQLPIVAVHDGLATSPVRIFGGETQCKLGEGHCPRVYLVTSDLVLDPPLLRRIATRLLTEVKGAKLVLCLDAVARAEGDATPDVYAAAGDQATLGLLDLKGVAPLGEALLAGMTGEVLLKGPSHDLPVGALVVEATQGLPDGRAGVALVQAVAQLMPDIPLDPKPLLDEAMELEDQIRKMQEEAERSKQTSRQLGTFV